MLPLQKREYARNFSPIHFSKFFSDFPSIIVDLDSSSLEERGIDFSDLIKLTPKTAVTRDFGPQVASQRQLLCDSDGFHHFFVFRQQSQKN